MNLKYFVMSLHCLNCYQPDDLNAGTWDIHPTTIRRKVEEYSATIQNLKLQKAILGDSIDEKIYIYKVDNFNFIINEPWTDLSPKWYDHNSKMLSLSINSLLSWTKYNYLGSQKYISYKHISLTIFWKNQHMG